MAKRNSNTLPKYIERDPGTIKRERTPIYDDYARGAKAAKEFFNEPMELEEAQRLFRHGVYSFMDEEYRTARAAATRHSDKSMKHGKGKILEFFVWSGGVPSILAYGIGKRLRIAVEAAAIATGDDSFVEDFTVWVDQWLLKAQAIKEAYASLGRRITRTTNLDAMFAPQLEDCRRFVQQLLTRARLHPELRGEVAELESVLRSYQVGTQFPEQFE